MASGIVDVEAEVVRTVESLDLDELRAAWLERNEFAILEHCLSAALVARLREDAEAVRSDVHRVRLPGYKKSGSVDAFTLAERAPGITALYRSPALLDLLRRLTGRTLVCCPARDPHAQALYFYTEPGDHVGAHRDVSHYRGRRYTVLVGIIERSTSVLVCRVAGRDAGEIRIATDPGTMVVFDGDTLWHRVTPLGAGEERVTLSLTYVTDGRMGLARRVVSDVKDAVAYFGFGAVFARRRYS